MKYQDSGLPADKLIEDAFNYSYTHTMGAEKESVRMFEQQMRITHMQNMTMLEEDARQGFLKEEDFLREKAGLDKMLDDQLKIGPTLIRKELEKKFDLRRVAPAQELVKHGDAPSSEIIAAVMLVECVRSPRDFVQIENRFGATIGRIVSDILHMEVYQSDRIENLTAAGADTKRAYMAMTSLNLDALSVQAEKLAKSPIPQKILFPPGQEEQIYAVIKTTWGIDQKFDGRLTAAFNRATTAVGSVYRIEVDAQGKPDLVKGNPPSTPPVTGPKKNLPVVKGPKTGGSIGGDVF